MSKCTNCPLRFDLPSDCGICPGNLPTEQCLEKLQGALNAMRWDLDHMIRTTDSVRPSDDASLKEIKKKLDLLPVPEKPDCLPDGNWDGNVIGRKAQGFSIIVDGKIISVSDTEAHILKGYAKALRRKADSEQKILRGEGIHKQGICPACGSNYKPWRSWSTGGNPFNHTWKCPDCGASGREMFESEFLGHFDLVDGNGNHIETPEKNEHDIYTCPCCGDRFDDPDDFGPDGYWDHGSGSYGENGCRARGRMRFANTFRYHADVRANKNKV